MTRRGVGIAAVFVIATVAVLDAHAIAIGGIHVYQRTLAPWADKVGGRCRFTPTCSHYAEAVIARDGLARGGWKAVKRLARCGPWTRAGTHDEP